MFIVFDNVTSFDNISWVHLYYHFVVFLENPKSECLIDNVSYEVIHFYPIVYVLERMYITLYNVTDAQYTLIMADTRTVGYR